MKMCMTILSKELQKLLSRSTRSSRSTGRNNKTNPLALIAWLLLLILIVSNSFFFLSRVAAASTTRARQPQQKPSSLNYNIPRRIAAESMHHPHYRSNLNEVAAVQQKMSPPASKNYNYYYHHQYGLPAAAAGSPYQYDQEAPPNKQPPEVVDAAKVAVDQQQSATSNNGGVAAGAADATTKTAAAEPAALNKLEISIRLNGHAAPDAVYNLPSEWLLNNSMQQQQHPKTAPPPPPPPSAPPAPQLLEAPSTPAHIKPSPSLPAEKAAPPVLPDEITTTTTIASHPHSPEAPLVTVAPPPPPPAQHPPAPPMSGEERASAFAEQQRQLVELQQQQQQALLKQEREIERLSRQQEQIIAHQQQQQQRVEQQPPPPPPPPPPEEPATSAPSPAETNSPPNALLASPAPDSVDNQLKQLLEEPDECSTSSKSFSDEFDDSRFFSPDSVQTEQTPADAKWASEKAFLFPMPENAKLKDEDPSHYVQILFPQPYKLYGWRVRGFAGAADGDNGGLAAYQAQVFDSRAKRWVHILDDGGEARVFSAIPTFKHNKELANEIYPVELSVPITDVAGIRIYPVQWVGKPYFKISLNGCALTVVSSSSKEQQQPPPPAPAVAGVGPNSKPIVIMAPPAAAAAAAFEVEDQQTDDSDGHGTGDGGERDDANNDNIDFNSDRHRRLRHDGYTTRERRRYSSTQVGNNSPSFRPSRPMQQPLAPGRSAADVPPNITLRFPHHKTRDVTNQQQKYGRPPTATSDFDTHDVIAPSPPESLANDSSSSAPVNSPPVAAPETDCQARLLHMADGLHFYRIDRGQQIRNLHSAPDLSSSSKRGWIVMRLLATPNAALRDADDNRVFGLELRFEKGAYVEKLIIASAVREPDLSSLVTAFTAQYLKLNDDEWQWVRDPATRNIRLFELPTTTVGDGDAAMSAAQMLRANHTVDFSFRAKLGALRIFPQRWYRFPGLRVGILGCVDA